MPDYALLVDGDNVNLSYLEPLKNKIEGCGGRISKIHLFGKLKSSYLDDWRQLRKKYSNLVTYNITANLKNSTDIKMLCVALQLYYNEGIKHFVIMSSDSDMESLINGLTSDAEIIVAYSEQKVAQDYLKRIQERGICCWNLDEIRGPLTEEDIDKILNQILKSYIRFKLGKQFFSYKTVLQWAVDRYPDLEGIPLEGIHQRFNDITLSFSENGVTTKK